MGQTAYKCIDDLCRKDNSRVRFVLRVLCRPERTSGLFDKQGMRTVGRDTVQRFEYRLYRRGRRIPKLDIRHIRIHRFFEGNNQTVRRIGQ